LRELRRALVDCLCCERGFEDRCAVLTETYDLGDIAAVEESTPRVTGDLDDRGMTLLGRIRRFDAGPLGITLSGPAYRDNPLRYANEAFRDLTGYPLDELRGENPRLLQGPATDPEAVATLRDAVDTWTEATVELRNYRRDGTGFRNRVTVVPVPDESGTIAHWLGIQAAVDG
jgi:PAS domain S-box-containing protein